MEIREFTNQTLLQITKAIDNFNEQAQINVAYPESVSFDLSVYENNGYTIITPENFDPKRVNRIRFQIKVPSEKK